jgi:hypothetical protein
MAANDQEDHIMDESANEIDLVVGSMINVRPDEDREAYEEEYERMQDVQEMLREEGIEVDLLSQPGTEVWEGGIASFYDLYQLKQLAAHLERGEDVKMLLSDSSPNGEEYDSLLADIISEEATTRFPHLIRHQGDGGFYLPADFSEPIWAESEDDEEEFDEEDDEDMFEEGRVITFGSSVALLRELTELEELFRQASVPLGGPRQALQTLKTGAEQSVSNGLPLILW